MTALTLAETVVTVALLAIATGLLGYGLAIAIDRSQWRLLRRQWSAVRAWAHDRMPVRQRDLEETVAEAYERGWRSGYMLATRVARKASPPRRM